MGGRLVLLGVLLFPLAAQGTDIPVRYTVNDTALRAATNGTPLTFALFSNAACTGSALHSAVIPVQDVTVISRLKIFKPKGAATSPPRTAELSTTLTGVSAAGNLYLQVTGAGVMPVGGACQAQAATVSSGAPGVVIEDANGAVIGVPATPENDVYVALPAGGLAVTKLNDNGAGVEFGPVSNFSLIYESADCTGQPYDFFYLTLRQSARYRAADQTLYATPTALVPIEYRSSLEVNRTSCNAPAVFVPPDGCCESRAPQIVFAGPAITVPVGGFVRPFRYNAR